MIGMDWIADDPVPITATRFPVDQETNSKQISFSRSVEGV
jgi:hypothetical protein